MQVDCGETPSRELVVAKTSFNNFSDTAPANNVVTSSPVSHSDFTGFLEVQGQAGGSSVAYDTMSTPIQEAGTSVVNISTNSNVDITPAKSSTLKAPGAKVVLKTKEKKAKSNVKKKSVKTVKSKVQLSPGQQIDEATIASIVDKVLERRSTSVPPAPSQSLQVTIDEETVGNMIARAIEKQSHQLVTQVEGSVRGEVQYLSNEIRQVSNKVEQVKNDSNERFGVLRDDIDAQTNPASRMPRVDSLPDCEPHNPWRSGISASLLNNNMIFLEGLGPRPVTDFERFPVDGLLPYVYLRLKPEAVFRQDKVPKETVLFPLNVAQPGVTRLCKETGALNTKAVPFKGTYTMFLSSPDRPTPFLTKVFEVCHEALIADKPKPTLREAEPTSLVLPNDSDIWNQVYATFTVGPLPANCASILFNEDLPQVPDSLLKREFSARSCLARTLHTMCLTEMMGQESPNSEQFKILAKSQVSSAIHDIFDFGVARRLCRKSVLQHAALRHEPTKLINSSIWGESLFPFEAVHTAVTLAAND